MIGKALNAVVVRQNYSRLVIDCNRAPGSGTSILDLTELTHVPGNIGLSERHKLARARESLLATDEPPPFTVDNENGTSPLLIVADHSGKLSGVSFIYGQFR
jgi:predicted N-formylglutamate amidohydrolase